MCCTRKRITRNYRRKNFDVIHRVYLRAEARSAAGKMLEKFRFSSTATRVGEKARAKLCEYKRKERQETWKKKKKKRTTKM